MMESFEFLVYSAINPSPDAVFAHIFSPFSQLSFHPVVISLTVRKFLSLIQSHLSSFAFVDSAFGISPKKIISYAYKCFLCFSNSISYLYFLSLFI